MNMKEEDIEYEQEEDGRWIASYPLVPGVMAYGATREEAESNVRELAKKVSEEIALKL